jgi:hypothetical protein
MFGVDLFRLSYGWEVDLTISFNEGVYQRLSLWRYLYWHPIVFMHKNDRVAST